MKRTHLKRTLLMLGALTSAAGMTTGQAQSVDSLLNKLVDKGILSATEAKDLRAEADKDFAKAYASKSGMPDWVTSVKLNGDFRARAEGFNFDNDAFNERLRYRYRLRFGVTAVLKDDFEVGLRLMSSDGAGGDPISGNTTLQDNASKKFIFIDLAYGKWTALKTKEMTDSITIGKMESPFVFTDLGFDPDYTPEGIANSFSYALNDNHTLKLAAGAFVMDELAASSNDPYYYGGQLRWDAKWSDKISSTLGGAVMNINNSQNLGNAAVPNVNVGNSRDAAGNLLYHYNPVIGDAAVTYMFDSAPLYKGAFPVKLYGEFIHNPAAPEENSAWTAGLAFGKTGKKGTWALDYRYKYLEADAWFEEFTDSDYGTLRPTAVPGSGQTAAYRAGTGAQGHLIRAGYSPFDSVTLQSSVWLTHLTDETGPGNSDTIRWQFDVLWKF